MTRLQGRMSNSGWLKSPTSTDNLPVYLNFLIITNISCVFVKAEEVDKEFEVGEAWWLAHCTLGRNNYPGTSRDFSLCQRFIIDTMNSIQILLLLLRLPCMCGLLML